MLRLTLALALCLAAGSARAGMFADQLSVGPFTGVNAYLPISGGTVTGETTYTNGLRLSLNTTLCFDTEENDCVKAGVEDRIDWMVNGGDSFFIRLTHVETGSGEGGLMNETPSGTNPTVVPNTSDSDTGLGTSGSDCLSLVAGGVEVARLCEATDSLLSMLGGLKPASKTSDPCGDTTNFPAGTMFYNSTAGEQCYCNNAGVDLRSDDGTTACF